jgi:hypothetical protein
METGAGWLDVRTELDVDVPMRDGYDSVEWHSAGFPSRPMPERARP